MQRLMDIIRELKRRKVFQVASIYLVTAWGASLGAAELLPAFGAPDGAVRAFVIVLLLAFPVVVALAWYFEITDKGVVLDSTAREAETESMDRRAQTTMIAMAPGTHSQLNVRWEDAGRDQLRTFATPFEMGRDAACDVSTLDPRASRRHARIEPRADGWWVVDLESRNGVLLDGRKVAVAPLPLDCSLQLGIDGPTYRLQVEDRLAETRLSQVGEDPA